VHGHLIVSNLPCRAVRVALDVAVLIPSTLADRFKLQVYLKFQFVPRSKRFHFSIIGTNLLMLCRELINIRSEIHT